MVLHRPVEGRISCHLPELTLISAIARTRLRRISQASRQIGRGEAFVHIWRKCFKVSAMMISVCFLWASATDVRALAQEKPTYKVDPFWPKPLPNKWIMQQVPTLTVDKDDHIWVLNRSRQ